MPLPSHCLGSSTMPPSGCTTPEKCFITTSKFRQCSRLCFSFARQSTSSGISYRWLAFVVYELVVAVLFGYTPLASMYIMTPGLVVIVAYSFYLFLRHGLFTIVHRKNAGRLLMLGALLLSYSCDLFVFYTYFMEEKADITNVYALHLVSSCIAAVMMSIGLYMMRRRIKEWQELKVTRRELRIVFGS